MYYEKRKFIYVILIALICFVSSPGRAWAADQPDMESLRCTIWELLNIFETYTPIGRDGSNKIFDLKQRLDKLPLPALLIINEVLDTERFTALVERLKCDYAQAESEPQSSGKAQSGSKVVTGSIIEPPNYEEECFPPRTPASQTLIDYVLVMGLLDEASNLAGFICSTGIFGGEGLISPPCVAAFFIESVSIVGGAVLALLAVCVGSVDSAEIEASWKNTVAIHDDVSCIQNKISTHAEEDRQSFDNIEKRLDGVDEKVQKILDLLNASQGGDPSGDIRD